MTGLEAPPVIEGVRLRLRLVTPEDAAYIHALRNDPTYNTHLTPGASSVEEQRAWIERYKEREAAGTEYYFVIDRLGGGPCGVVRVYDLDREEFSWGSWILDANKPPKAALESIFLVYRLGFDALGRKAAWSSARRGNERSLAFHRRLGAPVEGKDAENVYFRYSAEMFQSDRDRLASLLAEAG